MKLQPAQLLCCLLLILVLPACRAQQRPAVAGILRVALDDSLPASVLTLLTRYETAQGQPLTVDVLPASQLALGNFDLLLGLLEPVTGGGDIPLGQVELALVTSNQNPITRLDLEQARRLLSGQLLNWAEVGGPSLPVTLYSRESSSSLARSADELLLSGLPLSSSARLLPDQASIAEALLADPGGLAFLPASGLPEGLHTLAIFAASDIQQLQLQAALYARPLDPENRPVRELIEWLASPQGQAGLHP